MPPFDAWAPPSLLSYDLLISFSVETSLRRFNIKQRMFVVYRMLLVLKKLLTSVNSSNSESFVYNFIFSSTTYQKSSFNVRPDREKEESDDFRSRNLHTNLALTNRLGSAGQQLSFLVNKVARYFQLVYIILFSAK